MCARAQRKILGQPSELSLKRRPSPRARARCSGPRMWPIGHLGPSLSSAQVRALAGEITCQQISNPLPGSRKWLLLLRSG